MDYLSEKEIQDLRAWPTPAVSNAIETFDVRPRNEGFMVGIRCIFPAFEPMVGYACTATMRALEPGGKEHRKVTAAHWDNIAATHGPRVAVIQDLDQPPCVGSLWGEVNANLHRALGCVGVVTDGGVRDLDEVRALGFHFFAAEVIPSHAYVHLVDAGEPVKVAGLVVRNSDLIHGDKHGVVIIPAEVAREVPKACAEVEERERRVIDYCKSDQFDLEALKTGSF